MSAPQARERRDLEQSPPPRGLGEGTRVRELVVSSVYDGSLFVCRRVIRGAATRRGKCRKSGSREPDGTARSPFGVGWEHVVAVESRRVMIHELSNTFFSSNAGPTLTVGVRSSRAASRPPAIYGVTSGPP